MTEIKDETTVRVGPRVVTSSFLDPFLLVGPHPTDTSESGSLVVTDQSGVGTRFVESVGVPTK